MPLRGGPAGTPQPGCNSFPLLDVSADSTVFPTKPFTPRGLESKRVSRGTSSTVSFRDLERLCPSFLTWSPLEKVDAIPNNQLSSEFGKQTVFDLGTVCTYIEEVELHI